MADSSVDGGTVTPWDQRNTILRAWTHHAPTRAP